MVGKLLGKRVQAADGLPLGQARGKLRTPAGMPCAAVLCAVVRAFPDAYEQLRKAEQQAECRGSQKNIQHKMTTKPKHKFRI